jgi:hypothetical protein
MGHGLFLIAISLYIDEWNQPVSAKVPAMWTSGNRITTVSGEVMGSGVAVSLKIGATAGGAMA